MELGAWVVLCLCAAVVVEGYCPNDCSGANNGVCSDALVCQCKEGWAGDDCSISDVELRNHQKIEGRVETRQWAFFHILANSQQSSLEFQVNQTGTGGDIDAYVRFDKYPTKQDYDLRDISTSKIIKFEIPSPHGVYYLGIYGFLGSDFSAMATMKTACPNDCSGHGSCNFNGICTCRSGFMGNDCSQAVEVLPNSGKVSGEVHNAQWDYYSFDNHANTVVLKLKTPIRGEDCDVYVKVGRLPTLQDFDYRDTGVGEETELRISNAPSGIYYIGVFGFTEISHYELEASSFSECPNLCSGTTHGSCSPTFTCNCQRAYTGEACETKMVGMVLDDRIESGHVSGNAWNYYHFDTYTTSNVRIMLRQLNADADCDLYVRQAENPTRTHFDYRDTTQSVVTTLTLENPSVNTWYIGVYGYATCDYQLSALITQRCPNDCVGPDHGTCVEGHCVCKEGWTSADCSLRSRSLTNGVAADGALRNGQWNYFTFTAQPGSDITVALHEKASVGNVWLFVSASGVPTLAENDRSDTETNTNVHRIHLTVPEPSTIHVGVYGSVLAQTGKDYDYTVVTWQAIF